ncbi:hypothetical protein M408DRAFT_222147 [Serendipita vermifera MAFF 305830]|uniref:DUF86 domain-containing protein n=1 Tax=Serendipita vermifera MAFF 305830 TaxID=933852 RepID=A0A0C3AKY5_SERVB|nr:hypothetical protein M408DRAFT_222147 [Serendipita vermifera MAFF 305830]
MTTTYSRLLGAHTSITLVQQYITDKQFTEAEFVNPALGSEHYAYRAAILKEVEAIAENLNFPKDDSIRSANAEFWKSVSQLYGMRSIIAHRYGVTDLDYSLIWQAINDYIPNKILPTLEKLITENQP